MLKARNLPLLFVIGVSVAIAAAVTGVIMYYSFMPAWMSIEVSGEAAYDENGGVIITRGEGDSDVYSNVITLGGSELERFPALQRAIERADETYPAVPTGFDKLPSQAEARAAIDLLHIENEQGGTHRGHFVYNGTAYYIHIIYAYEHPVSA